MVVEMKQKVRIAVCMDSQGHYNSCGWDHGDASKQDYADMLNLAQEGMDFPEPNTTFWLTTEIDIPDEIEIAGVVE